VAGTGLKVAGFSASCESSVRVAGKGLREELLKVESSKLNGQKLKRELTVPTGPGSSIDSLRLKEETSGELNAETLSSQRRERRKADPSLRSG
jgi:hypothetical protein